MAEIQIFGGKSLHEVVDTDRTIVTAVLCLFGIVQEVQTSSRVGARRTLQRHWYEHWEYVAAVDDVVARHKAMTVKFKCSDGKVREFLLDTGASASLIPLAFFRKACSKVGLRPSRLDLRTASGANMAGKGTSVVHLRLPDDDMGSPPRISHRFEVMEEGAMPAGLLITGVDMWDELNPEIKWDTGVVKCRPKGQEPF